MPTLTKSDLVAVLAESNEAVARALVLLHRRQTTSEQISETTQNHNERGFRPCHARMGSAMAKFFERRGYLTDRQVGYWRSNMRDGNMRIAIYWKQLLEEVELKAQGKQDPIRDWNIPNDAMPNGAEVVAAKTTFLPKDQWIEKMKAEGKWQDRPQRKFMDAERKRYWAQKRSNGGAVNVHRGNAPGGTYNPMMDDGAMMQAVERLEDENVAVYKLLRDAISAAPALPAGSDVDSALARIKKLVD